MAIGASNATTIFPMVFRRTNGRNTVSGKRLLLIFFNICEFQSVSAKSRRTISRCYLTVPFKSELAFNKQIFAVLIDPDVFPKIRSFFFRKTLSRNECFSTVLDNRQAK